MVFSSCLKSDGPQNPDCIVPGVFGLVWSSAVSAVAYIIIISFAQKKKNEEFCQKLFEGSADEVGVANAVVDEVKEVVSHNDNSTSITHHASYHYTAHGKDGKTYDCKVSARMVPGHTMACHVGACLKVRYLLEAPGAVRLELVADNELQHAAALGVRALYVILFVLAVLDMLGSVGGVLTECFCAVEFVAAIGLGQRHAQQMKMSEFGVSKDVTVTIADGRASTDLGQALLSGA